MPQVQIQNYNGILARMINKIIAQTAITDFEDSSIVKQILSAVAREIDDSNYQLTRLQDLFSIERAAGDDLDQKAVELLPAGLSRVQAQPAIGYLVFSRSTNTGTTLVIPSGVTVRTSTGISVRTIQPGTITATSAELITGHGVGRDSNLVSAVATQPGTSGNIGVNTAVRFTSRPVGVSEVTNSSAFVLGRNRESDEEFRTRIRLYISSLASSTPDALKYAVLQQRLTNGQRIVYAHVAEDPLRPGYASLYIDDGAGTAEQYVNIAPTDTLVGATISAPSASIQTLTVPSGPFLAAHVGRTITIANAAAANNGTFTILSVQGTTQVTYSNAGGSAQTIIAPSTATYAVQGETLTAGLLGPPANSAVGGEEYLDLVNSPVRIKSAFAVTSSTRGALTQGTHYTLNPANGRLRFTPALAAGEVIVVQYTYYTGLIALAQRIVDGDPNDRITYPGVRAAGVTVVVQTPQVVPLTVRVTLSLERGANRPTVETNVENAILSYINELGISGDVIRNEMIERIMRVTGVLDCTLELPAANIVMLDNQLPRITANDIDIF